MCERSTQKSTHPPTHTQLHTYTDQFFCHSLCETIQVNILTFFRLWLHDSIVSPYRSTPIELLLTLDLISWLNWCQIHLRVNFCIVCSQSQVGIKICSKIFLITKGQQLWHFAQTFFCSACHHPTGTAGIYYTHFSQSFISGYQYSACKK